jgi:hypothetical protein
LQPVTTTLRPPASLRWSTASNNVPLDLAIVDCAREDEEEDDSSYSMNQEIHFRMGGDVTTHTRRG